MAFRLYLNNAAAPYTPTTKRGAWDDSSATLARELGVARLGASATAAVAETNTANNYDVLCGRWVSDGFQASGTISSATATVMAKWLESNAAANMLMHVHIFVTTGDSDTVRGTLLADYVGGSEFATTTNQSRGTGAQSLSSFAVTAGDRIVVEIGYQAQNTSATSYTGTLRYGGTDGVDSTESDTTNARPGWVEFGGFDGLFGRQWGAFSDDFDDNSIDAAKWDSWGGANVTESSQRINIDPSTASGAYYGMDNLHRRSLTGQSVHTKVVAAGTAQAGLGFYPIQLQVSDLNGVYWYINNGTAYPYKVVQNTYTQLDAGRTHTDLDWYRIREASGTMYWEYSTNGTSWSTQYSEANPIPTGLMSCSIFTETTTTISATSISFDSFNITPSGSQAINATGIASTATIGSPTASPGSVSTSPTGITSTSALGTPTLLATITIATTGIGGTASLGVPTLTPGSVSISASGIASTTAIGTAAVASTVSISPTGIASTVAVGSPAITPGSVTISATGVASTAAIGTPTLTPGSVGISAAGVTSTATIGSVTVSSTYTIATTGISSTVALGLPLLTPGAVSISPSGVASAVTLGIVTASPGSVTISVAGIGSAVSVGTPSVTASYTITPSGLSSAVTIGSPTVAPGSVVISATGKASTLTFGTPNVSTGLNISPTGIASAISFGMPILVVVSPFHDTLVIRTIVDLLDVRPVETDTIEIQTLLDTLTVQTEQDSLTIRGDGDNSSIATVTDSIIVRSYEDSLVVSL